MFHIVALERPPKKRDPLQTLNLGSPWENGYCESFNGKSRDQFSNGEIFQSLKEAIVQRGDNHQATCLPMRIALAH